MNLSSRCGLIRVADTRTMDAIKTLYRLSSLHNYTSVFKLSFLAGVSEALMYFSRAVHNSCRITSATREEQNLRTAFWTFCASGLFCVRVGFVIFSRMNLLEGLPRLFLLQPCFFCISCSESIVIWETSGVHILLTLDSLRKCYCTQYDATVLPHPCI